jgi:plasmid stability protein
MPDVLIRNVPQPTLDALKRRADQSRRSLQQELATILDLAARDAGTPTPAEIAATIQARLAASGRTYSDSAPLIREDRER